METAERRMPPVFDLDAELESVRAHVEEIASRVLRGEWDPGDLLAGLRDVALRLSALERLRADERCRLLDQEQRRRRSLKAALTRQP